MEYSPVTAGAARQVLPERCVRVASRDGVHAGTVSAYLPRHCARIPANQPGNLTAAQANHIIFPYTTALFYTKMMAVHTLSLLAARLCSYSVLPPGGLYELLVP